MHVVADDVGQGHPAGGEHGLDVVHGLGRLAGHVALVDQRGPRRRSAPWPAAYSVCCGASTSTAWEKPKLVLPGPRVDGLLVHDASSRSGGAGFSGRTGRLLRMVCSGSEACLARGEPLAGRRGTTTRRGPRRTPGSSAGSGRWRRAATAAPIRPKNSLDRRRPARARRGCRARTRCRARSPDRVRRRPRPRRRRRHRSGGSARSSAASRCPARRRATRAVMASSSRSVEQV